MADVSDVDAITRELYGLRPDEFTAGRDAYVARARAAGESVAAKQIKALRKPTLAVWAANLLARSEADQTRRLLELGQALREAHRTLAGEELRELSHQRHEVIAAMAGQARRLADEAGQPITEGAQHDVEQILHAVLADPDTAQTWAAGVLAKPPPAAVGFENLEPAPGTAAPRTKKRPPTAPVATGAPAPGPVQADTREEKRARARVDRTSQEYREAEEELALAEKELTRSRARLEPLDRQIATLQEQLQTAREQHSHYATEADTALRRQQRADKKARTARTAAEEAQKALDELHRGKRRR
ncbi:hypothetical protein ACFYZ9_31295 [Streptomyces sp. NPDC001691]|uniref:hypothetical protein n=1 Tax=Streptomyces sp. NPDC001691 TaxID=3364600 RepID=UPI00368C1059